MSSVVIDTAIGLVLVFAIFAGVVSGITEAITRFIGLRGEYLLRGLRTMLDGPSTFSLGGAGVLGQTQQPDRQPGDWLLPRVTQVLRHPLIAATADGQHVLGVGSLAHVGDAKLSRADRARLPSYVSGRSFARAIVDIAIPNAAGATSLTAIEAQLGTLADGPMKEALLAIAKSTGDDLDAFRTGIEEWYDDQMARVSGWYKRHTRWISLGIGAVLVLLLNLNAVAITQTLYTDPAVRDVLVAQASSVAPCATNDTACTKTEFGTLRSLGLPIGWGAPSICQQRSCSGLDRFGLSDPSRNGFHDLLFFVTVLLGWLLMVFALVPGARFWFDSLSRLGSLRSTGPKPPTL